MIPDPPISVCPGCGIALERAGGPVHAYFGHSPECWALFGSVLARQYQDPEGLGVHQLVVDAYASQHPGRPGRRQTQSVWMHLATLYLVLERGHDARHGPAMHRRLMARPDFQWLEPPLELSETVTVAAVAAAGDPDAHRRAVRRWAEAIWKAWSPHHAAIRAWVDAALGSTAR